MNKGGVRSKAVGQAFDEVRETDTLQCVAAQLDFQAGGVVEHIKVIAIGVGVGDRVVARLIRIG